MTFYEQRREATETWRGNMDTLNVTRMGDQGPTLVFLHGLMGLSLIHI